MLYYLLKELKTRSGGNIFINNMFLLNTGNNKLPNCGDFYDFL